LVKAEHYEARRRSIAGRLAELGADYFFTASCPAFGYLTGLGTGYPSERLVAVIIARDGSANSICPAFEVSRLVELGLPGIHPWEEHEDPFAIAHDIIGKTPNPTVLVEGRLWFDWLLRLKAGVPGATFKSGSQLVHDLRMHKTPEELDLMGRACDVTEKAIHLALSRLQIGITEKEFGKVIARAYEECGVTSGALVQSGPNSAIPHGAPKDRRIEDSDVLLIDTGCQIEGYASDITRTYVINHCSERFREIYNIVLAAQGAGIAAARPGNTCEHMDFAARRVIEDAGYGRYFTHRLGHGIGLEVHEEPYLVKGNKRVLEPGMTFTVEPGIYVEGEFGVRIEDDVVITDTGCRVISDSFSRVLTVIKPSSATPSKIT
jgi:Xaa-Pro dipeptidase